ncbi:retrovirus-related pol polyprotein from transposon TNT 1-94 [Tanacetum coccineum]
MENESQRHEISDLKKVIEKWTSSKVTIDQLFTKQVPGNIIRALGGRGKKKDTISSKEVLFSKAAESPSETVPEITSDSESECGNLEPLPPLPKLTRAEPIGTSADVLTQTDLTLTLIVSEGIKKNADTHPLRIASYSDGKRKMENLNKVRVKEMRSDNGTEFKNHKLEEFYDEKGISQNFSFSMYPCNKLVLKAIRIFLAYAAYIGFMVFQMDVKSDFLIGKISKEVYVQQPPGFESSEFPNHVCKLDKALCGLEQAPRAWYKHSLNFSFSISLSECLSEMPYASPNNLGPDESGVSVNETLFRGMIGSLMYLTASRPDIQFSTCLYARYQANPKESHLVAVKRIFKYLKGTQNLGLWYLKGSGFDLKAYSDLDYAGCNLDRKSTSGGCQMLGGKLVCWSAKKQSSLAMSLAKAEYVAAAR